MPFSIELYSAFHERISGYATSSSTGIVTSPNNKNTTVCMNKRFDWVHKMACLGLDSWCDRWCSAFVLLTFISSFPEGFLLPLPCVSVLRPHAVRVRDGAGALWVTGSSCVQVVSCFISGHSEHWLLSIHSFALLCLGFKKEACVKESAFGFTVTRLLIICLVKPWAITSFRTAFYLNSTTFQWQMRLFEWNAPTQEYAKRQR